MFIVYAHMCREIMLFIGKPKGRSRMICVDIIIYFISHSFVYRYPFNVVCIFVVSAFLRVSLVGYEHDMHTFLGSADTDG